MTHKKRKKLKKKKKKNAGCSLLRAEGISCSFDVLYLVLERSKLQIFIPKNIKFSFQLYISPIFGHENPKMPDPESMNPDSKQWYDSD